MQRLELKATTRENGKGFARRARMAGNIPGVVYGKVKEPMSVSVRDHDFRGIERKEKNLNVLIDLEIDGKEKFLTVVKAYQAHPIKRNFTHVDFQAIDIKQKIEVEVPVVLAGVAPGVKDGGGILEHFRRTILVSALPNTIPSNIEVDVSNLQVGENIHADEIRLPEGVDFHYSTNFTIVTVVAPKKEEEEVAAAPVEGEEGDQVATAGEEGAAPAAEAKKD